MKKFIPLLFIALFFTSCTDKQTKVEIQNHKNANLFNQYIIQEKSKYQKSIDDYVSSLTLEQKISQLFIENLEGCSSFRSYETVGEMNQTDDKTPLVAGGYIFFSYNIAATRDKMKDFITSINEYCDNNKVIPPYFAVDQEGGYVTRLKNLNTKLPSNEDVAMNNTVEQSYYIYEEQALEMKDLGFHMNLAPVIEVCTDSNKDFLDGRSFGNAKNVIKYGTACVNAYENNGIATVVKHFPGNNNTDPHTGLPEIDSPRSQLMEEIEPFRQIIDYHPTAVLMSHARTKAIDKDTPACLSSVWITQILRNEFKFDGIIFSDDIFMGALNDNGYPPEKAVIMAIEAGIDCIMISEKRFAKSAAVIYNKAITDSEFEEKINCAVRRIIKYKIDNGIIKN